MSITKYLPESPTHTFNFSYGEPKVKGDIERTLDEREGRYGSFDQHARITQGLKDCMVNEVNWGRLSASQKEALEMIAHKIGRILNGDPNYKDSWHDIVGYAKLVDDQLKD